MEGHLTDYRAHLTPVSIVRGVIQEPVGTLLRLFWGRAPDRQSNSSLSCQTQRVFNTEDQSLIPFDLLIRKEVLAAHGVKV